MDSFLLQAMVHELSGRLTGQRIGKIHQSGATDLSLDFGLRDGRCLIVSTDSSRLAVFLGNRPRATSDRKASGLPQFAALARKYLGTARLINLTKVGYDRVVHLEFSAIEESGASVIRRLVLSLTGRSADVYLVEGEDVLASLRNRTLPGGTYQDPEPARDRLDPFLLPESRWLELIGSNGWDVMAASTRLLGFTQTLARELAYIAHKSDPASALTELLARLQEFPSTPTIYSRVPLDRLSGEIGNPEFDLVLSHIVLHHLESYVSASFHTLSEASEVYHTLINERRDFTERRQRLVSHTSARLKKHRSLRSKLTQELTKFGTADELRRSGELLLANLQSAGKSDDDFLVTDYFDPDAPVIRIPAAGQSDARTAAAHYFRLARKAKTGAKAIAERIPDIDSDIQRHEGVIEEAEQITSMDMLNRLLSRAGLVAPAKTSKGTSTKGAEKVERISGVRRYKSSDGYEILVGRTERDNDNLTLRIAKSFDLWFHSADYPGSHVVLRNPQRKPVAARSIMEAAQLAAKFSHAKGEAKVAVHYCERKFVSKSKGAPPGQVRLSSFKTILVEPREAGERLP